MFTTDTTTNETLRKLLLSGKLESLQPCFLYDGEQFASNLATFYSGFAEYFGDAGVRPSYSTKTNSDINVLKTVCQSSDWMVEIVSPHELSLVRAAGFSYDRVVYNGVIPDVEGKYLVAVHGGIVNVENLTELKALSMYAAHAGIPIEIGLRVNIKADESREKESRFGVMPHTEQFERCLECQNGYLKIVGIHCHVRSGRELRYWKNRARMMGELALELGARYIDFGSNMIGFMDPRLAEQYDCDVPTATDYAKTIHDELKSIYGDNDLPLVILEPGTPVVGNVVTLLGKVENIYERGFDTIATASCSIYDCGFFHGSDKQPPIDVVHMGEGKHYEGVEIFGYACTEDDTVCKSYTGELAVGDYLLVRNVGAYGNSLSSNFIKPALETYDSSRFQ